MSKCIYFELLNRHAERIQKHRLMTDSLVYYCLFVLVKKKKVQHAVKTCVCEYWIKKQRFLNHNCNITTEWVRLITHMFYSLSDRQNLFRMTLRTELKIYSYTDDEQASVLFYRNYSNR